jgi:hypothetical protein
MKNQLDYLFYTSLNNKKLQETKDTNYLLLKFFAFTSVISPSRILASTNLKFKPQKGNLSLKKVNVLFEINIFENKFKNQFLMGLNRYLYEFSGTTYQNEVKNVFHIKRIKFPFEKDLGPALRDISTVQIPMLVYQTERSGRQLALLKKVLAIAEAIAKQKNRKYNRFMIMINQLADFLIEFLELYGEWIIFLFLVFLLIKTYIYFVRQMLRRKKLKHKKN